MIDSDKACLDETSLRRFLDEQLTTEEEQLAQAHIGGCNNCRSQLERSVISGSSWDDLSDQLHALEFDPASMNATYQLEERLDVPGIKHILAPTDDPTKIGRLGRYEVCGIIGQGSMGLVLKALDPSLNRFVAIKMLAPGYSHLGTSRRRFEREGRAIASVRDPHVIEVYGVDEFRGNPYIVMQYFPDGSLHRRLERTGWLTTKEVCRIGLQIAKGLAAAHDQGIVHRDIKPANILLESGTESSVVTDFGLARVTDDATMTFSGTIAGTPQFMSPEQAEGHPLDTRTDLFSLGAVLYASCTGVSPFRGETLMGVVRKVCETDPRPIREINTDIEPWLEAFILKLLSKLPEDRFQTAGEVARLLSDELAHMQMPTTLAEPSRDWLPKNKSWLPCNRKLIAGGLGLVMLAIVCLSAVLPDGSFFRQGVTPTTAEKRFFEAKAAFELAYKTHIEEAALHGYMANSIEAHEQAYKLGFNRAFSAYNLACAYSIEGNSDKAFAWMDKALAAGFYEANTIEKENDLDNLRGDPRLAAVMDRVSTLSCDHMEAQHVYFGEEDYAKAEKLYRKWLKQCPDDEHATMMLGASLLEQRKLDEAETWNQRTRQSVRFANFGSYNLGCIAALRGDADLAFVYLNLAADSGFTDVKHIKQDRHLTDIQADPRFELLLERLQKQEPTQSHTDGQSVPVRVRQEVCVPPPMQCA